MEVKEANMISIPDSLQDLFVRNVFSKFVVHGNRVVYGCHLANLLKNLESKQWCLLKEMQDTNDDAAGSSVIRAGTRWTTRSDKS